MFTTVYQKSIERLTIKTENLIIMKDYKKKYYEQSIFWNQNYLNIPSERERMQEIINIIPADIKTILDVGCGNGAFINSLTSTFPDKFERVVGLDFSEEALKYVETDKLYGSITDIPFKDNSFDLVTSLEVLEHLSQEDFKKGISELQRVSKKYIIVTVPNNQDLRSSLVVCPKCYCWFNPNFHMRSFNRSVLDNLFISFRPIKIKEIGPLVEYRSYNHLLLTFYRSWRKSVLPETAICPQCGYQHKEELKDPKTNNENTARFSSWILSLFNPLVKLISPVKKKKPWLITLYEKTSR